MQENWKPNCCNILCTNSQHFLPVYSTEKYIIAHSFSQDCPINYMPEIRKDNHHGPLKSLTLLLIFLFLADWVVQSCFFGGYSKVKHYTFYNISTYLILSTYFTLPHCFPITYSHSPQMMHLHITLFHLLDSLKSEFPSTLWTCPPHCTLNFNVLTNTPLFLIPVLTMSPTIPLYHPLHLPLGWGKWRRRGRCQKSSSCWGIKTWVTEITSQHCFPFPHYFTFPHSDSKAFLHIYERDTSQVVCYGSQPPAWAHADGESYSWLVW